MLLLSGMWTTWLKRVVIQIPRQLSCLQVFIINKYWSQQLLWLLFSWFFCVSWLRFMSKIHSGWGCKAASASWGLSVQARSTCEPPGKQCVPALCVGRRSHWGCLEKAKIQMCHQVVLMSPEGWWDWYKELCILALGSAQPNSGKSPYHPAHTRLEKALI